VANDHALIMSDLVKHAGSPMPAYHELGVDLSPQPVPVHTACINTKPAHRLSSVLVSQNTGLSQRRSTPPPSLKNWLGDGERERERETNATGYRFSFNGPGWRVGL